MALHGKPDNFKPNSGNANGTLYLTYELGEANATFTYQGPGKHDPQQGPYNVTFISRLVEGVGTPGNIAHIGRPPLHIPGPGGGDFHSGAMTFTPRKGTTKGSLVGTFSSRGRTDLNWAADSDTATSGSASSPKAGE